MVRLTADTARSILLIGVGILVFLAPIKFGMLIDSEDLCYPDDIYEWAIYAWPHAILQMGIIILFTLWLVWGVASGKIRLRYSLLDFIILIFLLSSIISTFRAPNKHLAHLCLTQYFCYALIYFLILNILDNKKDLGFLLWMIIIPAVLISLYAIYQFYIGLPQTRNYASQYLSQKSFDLIKDRLESNRVFATFIYPNTLAGYLLLCIPITLTLPYRNRGGRSEGKRVWIFITLIMLYALYLTFYRGAGSAGKIENTLVNRFEYWSAGGKMIKEHPIFGAGTYNFGVFYPKYKLDIAEEVRNAHNNFLQIWAEQGILGFFAFCAIWIFVLIKGLRAKKGIHKPPTPIYRCGGKWISSGILIGLIAFIIHNLIDFDWYVPGLSIIAWVFVGILVWITNYREKIFVIRKCRIRSIFLIIILPVFFFVLINIERNFIAGHYLQSAWAAFNKKDLTLSEVFCKTSMKIDRDNPDTYFLLGRIYTEKRDYLNSISWYKKAIEYNPYNSLYYYHMALSYIYHMQTSGDMSLKKYIGEAFKKAVEYYPTNPFYRLQLAQFYEISNQPDLAMKEYNYCLELNSKIEKEYKVRGKMLRHVILPDNAVESIKKGLDKNKD